MDGVADGCARKSEIAGQPDHGKTQAALPFEEAMAQQMGIDGALNDREPQPWRENIFKLFPHLYSIELFVFHGFRPLGGGKCRNVGARFSASPESVRGNRKEGRAEARPYTGPREQQTGTPEAYPKKKSPDQGRGAPFYKTNPTTPVTPLSSPKISKGQFKFSCS